MQVGVALPSNLGLPDPVELVEMAVLAEKVGFDVVWLGEHVFNAGYIRDRLGDLPYYAPLSMLSFIAARTQRIRLGTSVLVLPNYHPATLAKYLATLDHHHGADDVMLRLNTKDMSQLRDELGRIGLEVLPVLKAS